MPFKGEIGKVKGALISMDKVLQQGLQLIGCKIEVVFVAPAEVIYKGQVVGEHSRDNDLEVNL